MDQEIVKYVGKKAADMAYFKVKVIRRTVP
jgi:hypothetical protein